MKVLHIIQDFPPQISGAGMWCKQVCDFLIKRGHRVKVLTLESDFEEVNGGYLKDIEIIRCKKVNNPLILSLKRLRPKKFYRVMRYIWERTLGSLFSGSHSMELYLRLFKEIKECDLVHLHIITYFYVLWAFFIAKFYQKKILITPYFHKGNREHERNINYWILKNCNAIFTMTEFEKKLFVKRGIRKDKIFVVPFPIDLTDYMPDNLDQFKLDLFKRYEISQDARIVVYLGRKQEYKGVDTLIEAVKKIKKDRPLKLLLIGPGSSWFSAYYAKLSKEDKVDIIDLGCVTHRNKVNLLHISDLLALPSRYESLGVVLLESFACGLPVVGSNVATIASLIEDCGYTFEYNDINDLSEKINNILDNRYLSQDFSKRGREKVSSYLCDNLEEKIFNAYLYVYPRKDNEKTSKEQF